MLNITRDIRTLSEFKRNTTQLLRQLKRTGEPIILTLNGKAEVVVLDAESYQAQQQAMERLQTIQGIQEGLDQMRSGQMLTLEVAKEEAAKKYGIQA